jgi:hypothetical protein
VAATIVTLVTLDPFRAHPWYELAYWLFMYSILFVLVPVTFSLNERAEGGRLPVEAPYASFARAAVAALGALLLVAGIGLLFELSYATRLWPFAITPLVARILGVWLGCLGLAHLWTTWDGDRLRAHALLLSMPLTGALLALVPLLHRDDLRDHPTGALVAYLVTAGAAVVIPLFALRRPRAQPRARPGPRRAGDAAAASPPPSRCSRISAERHPSKELPHPFEEPSLVRGTASRNPFVSAVWRRGSIPRTRDYEGVTRYASKTASIERSELRRERSALTSPTSAVYQFFASWSSTTPP